MGAAEVEDATLGEGTSAEGDEWEALNNAGKNRRMPTGVDRQGRASENSSRGALMRECWRQHRNRLGWLL